MRCKCLACNWRGSIPEATAPGAKLSARACPECGKHKLRRLTAAARRNLDAIRADVREIVTHAAKTGKLPDGSPIAPHTLLEQMAGLEPGASKGEPAEDSAAAWGRLAPYRRNGDLMIKRGAERLQMERVRTRAAVVQAKATKRELRRVASSLAALAEVTRVGVDTLGEMKHALLQIYAGFDCCVRLLVDLRDGKSPRGMKALRDYLEPTPDLSPLLEPIREQPKPGDVLTFDSGTTWTVSGTASGVVLVALCAPETSGTHEKAVTREEWRNAVDTAHQIARPGVLAFDRSAPITDAELRRNIIGAAPVFNTRERVAVNPRRGDVTIDHDGERREVLAVVPLEGTIEWRVHWRTSKGGEGWSNSEPWARNVGKAKEVIGSPLAGDETEAEADAILAQKPESAEEVKP